MGLVYFNTNEFEYKYPQDVQYSEEFRRIEERAIPGVLPYYLVSNFGRVWNCRRGKYLKQTPDKDGYLRVGLLLYPDLDMKLRVRECKVHRLVLLAFDYNPNNLNLVVNHIDNDPTHNYYEMIPSENSALVFTNLEWTTTEENTRHACSIGANNHNVDINQVIGICKMLDSNNRDIPAIAKANKVSKSVVFKILNHEIWNEVSCKYNF